MGLPWPMKYVYVHLSYMICKYFIKSIFFKPLNSIHLDFAICESKILVIKDIKMIEEFTLNKNHHIKGLPNLTTYQHHCLISSRLSTAQCSLIFKRTVLG